MTRKFYVSFSKLIEFHDHKKKRNCNHILNPEAIKV